MHSPFMSVVGRVVILWVVCCASWKAPSCAFMHSPEVVHRSGLLLEWGFSPSVCLTPCSVGGKSSVPAERSQWPRWREDCTQEVVCASQKWSPGDKEHWWNWVLALPVGVAQIWEWLLLIQGSVERQWLPSLCTVSVFNKITTLSFLSSSW